MCWRLAVAGAALPCGQHQPQAAGEATQPAGLLCL
jgi:hypothetical protein